MKNRMNKVNREQILNDKKLWRFIDMICTHIIEVINKLTILLETGTYKHKMKLLRINVR